MPFIANTDAQRAEMLAAIGISAEGLFADIPPELRCGPLKMPPALSEQAVRLHLANLADRNANVQSLKRPPQSPLTATSPLGTVNAKRAGFSDSGFGRWTLLRNGRQSRRSRKLRKRPPSAR